MSLGWKKELGRWGEAQAAQFLARRGFRVIERNWYGGRFGEIDIVASKNGDYYFIEVKTRAAGPLATDLAVTPFKQRRLQALVGRYSLARGLGDGGQVCAGLLVIFNRERKTLKFRFTVYH